MVTVTTVRRRRSVFQPLLSSIGNDEWGDEYQRVQLTVQTINFWPDGAFLEKKNCSTNFVGFHGRNTCASVCVRIG